MIILSEFEAFSSAVTLIGIGTGIGYKMALKNIITVEDSFCDVLHSGKKHRGNIRVILLNGKRKNNNCPEQSRGLCRLNNQKCHFMG